MSPHPGRSTRFSAVVGISSLQGLTWALGFLRVRVSPKVACLGLRVLGTCFGFLSPFLVSNALIPIEK